LPERAFAMPRKDLVHGQARPALDALIQVDEGSTCALRHQATERGFAARHEAVEKKWSLHARDGEE